MIVTVKLIATYRKYLPAGAQGNAVQIDVQEGSSAEDALRALGVPLDNSSVILVNGRTPQSDQGLAPGDVIHAFPALAGG